MKLAFNIWAERRTENKQRGKMRVDRWKIMGQCESNNVLSTAISISISRLSCEGTAILFVSFLLTPLLKLLLYNLIYI